VLLFMGWWRRRTPRPLGGSQNDIQF
jgi:hypothetical protein